MKTFKTITLVLLFVLAANISFAQKKAPTIEVQVIQSDYIIVSSYCNSGSSGYAPMLKELAKTVNRYLKLGWICQGSLAITPASNSNVINNMLATQVLIKQKAK
jgi:hypothetical protein